MTLTPWHDWNEQELRLTRTRDNASAVHTTATTADLLAYLRLPSTSGTTQLVETLGAATGYVETLTGTTIDESTLVLTLDLSHCREDMLGNRRIHLPLGPVTSVDKIEDDEAEYASGLSVDLSTTPHSVLLPEDALSHGECEITYSAGWDDWDDISQPIRTACLFAFAHFWQNREAVASVTMTEIPHTLSAALRLADYRLPI